MATGKLLASDYALSTGLRGYFSCCFTTKSSPRQSSEEETGNAGKNGHALGQTYNADCSTVDPITVNVSDGGGSVGSQSSRKSRQTAQTHCSRKSERRSRKGK